MSPDHSPPDTDPLTGLAVRRAVAARLEAARERGELVGVISLDIDHMKRVNLDRLHTGGDDALVRVAAVLKTIAVEAATVGRYGGDDFLIVVPGMRAEGLIPLAEWIREEIKTRLRDYHLTASLGVADSRHAGAHTRVEDAAHEAQISAKRAGRDRVVLYGTG